MKTSICLSLVSALFACNARAAAPVVANVRAAQIAGTKNVEILYDVSDADGDALTIGVQISGDAGATYTIPATALSGNVGAGVAVGVNNRIVWNAGVDWNGQYVPFAKVRVTASDSTTFAPPPGMAFIPAGTFQMGDSFAEGASSERPLRSVSVSGFFMNQTEVTYLQYQDVSVWGAAHQYNFGGIASTGNDKPATGMQWYQAVCWCNARSEKDGLTPVYNNDTAFTQIIRNIGAGLAVNPIINPTANGYRLPTEAEWEKAARGGVHGNRYPVGNSISVANAQFQNTELLAVKQFLANGYGLFDMAGNANEWCGDAFDAGYYGNSVAVDPVGPAASSYSSLRVLRGGQHNDGAGGIRVSARASANSSSGSVSWGFRCVRKAP